MLSERSPLQFAFKKGVHEDPWPNKNNQNQKTAQYCNVCREKKMTYRLYSLKTGSSFPILSSSPHPPFILPAVSANIVFISVLNAQGFKMTALVQMHTTTIWRSKLGTVNTGAQNIKNNAQRSGRTCTTADLGLEYV